MVFNKDTVLKLPLKDELGRKVIETYTHQFYSDGNMVREYDFRVSDGMWTPKDFLTRNDLVNEYAVIESRMTFWHFKDICKCEICEPVWKDLERYSMLEPD